MTSNNVYSITTDDVCPKNDNDKRCAPHLKFEHGSCIRLSVLSECARAFNDEFPNNKIALDNKMETLHPHKYKKYLLSEIGKRLNKKCTTQKCWAQQNFIKRMESKAREELQKYTFRPEGPDEGREWLNTNHINEVMAQYELKYPNFKFLNAVPRDFQDHDEYDKTDDDYRNLIKRGKTIVGIVFNTDKAGESGEHWNALYINFDEAQVYFFDSYGVPPNEEVKAHMIQIDKFMKHNCGKITIVDHNRNNVMTCKRTKLDHNKVRHQRKGSECGVYSINFILRMLRGDTFEDICNNPISDDHVNKCRKVYFTKK
jgi:hypothetical protein